jgi:hypothetical protein
MRSVVHVTSTKKKRSVGRVWWGNLRGKRPIGRPRRKWEDNIKIDLQEVECGVWTGSFWHRVGTGGEHL